MHGRGTTKMTELTKAHTIISYYQTQYKNRYGKTATVNRNKVQYLIVNILKDWSVKQVKELIDFYLETDKNPNLSLFCYEYDEVLESMHESIKDLENRKNLLSQTEKAVQEFRRRYGAGK
jgi:hypothetical protein